MLLLAVGIHSFVNSAYFSDGIKGARSGSFAGLSQNVSNEGWTFSARQANGSNTVFAELEKASLNNFKVESEIGRGEMFLTISQDLVKLNIDLDQTSSDEAGKTIDMSMFSPGRIKMELEFIKAEDINVSITWGAST